MQQTFNLLSARYGFALLEFGIWLVGGLIVQQIISALLRNAATKNQSRTAQALVVAAKGIIVWASGLIGFWVAYHNVLLMNKLNQSLEEQLRAYQENYLLPITIVLITIFSARVIGRFITAYTARENTKIPSSSIFSNIISAGIYIIGTVVILKHFNTNLTPVLTALGVGGIAIGLALQPTLDNLFSGIQILASRQIEPGDFVRLESGEEGTVEDVTWRNTTIRRTSSELVIVPNSALAKSLVVNFSRNTHAYSLFIPSTVAYGSNLEEVTHIVKEVAAETMKHSHYVYKEEKPELVFSSNTEGGISFVTVLPIIAYNQRARVISDYLTRLQSRFAQANVQQLSPRSSSLGK
jgi:small-conductance mechanosensitive channel